MVTGEKPRESLRWRLVRQPLFLLSICFGLWMSGEAAASPSYPWLQGAPVSATLEAAAPPPPGFRRLPAEAGSFAAWLRGLPMKPSGAPVRLYDGRLKWHQTYHAAVIDIDTGKQDLQQCADAIMRLRAEYLLASRRASEIAFNYTNGQRVSYPGWLRRNGGGGDYNKFRRYMTAIFTYAGSYSLQREMAPAGVADMRIGDVFIQGGFPGHAVLVIDMAAHPATGEKRFLLMQSYMPAQDMHVLKNPKSPDGTPWYPLNFGEKLVTPEWIFEAKDLRRFKD